MGNGFACFTAERTTLRKKSPMRSTSRFDFSLALSDFSTGGTASPSSSAVKTKKNGDDLLKINEEALVAAVLLAEQHRRSSLQFNRSASVAYPPRSPKKKRFPRSSSAKQQSNLDPVISTHRFSRQDGKMDGSETRHFVLVHGGGYGAWCWYKTMTLLEGSGYKVDAVDLAGSGGHPSNSKSITSLAQYADPLTRLLRQLNDEDKVILVGHDLGGACISYAMEMFPSKISKAVFIAATMLANGQSALQLLSKEVEMNDMMQKAQVSVHENGTNQPPATINLDKAFLKELLFGRSPAKDVALATLSMRPIPLSPLMEKMNVSKERYGSVKRFYIGTKDDCAISASTQDAMMNSNPPDKVFWLKNSDHSPFFSRPQALHKIFLEISLL